MNSKSNMSLAPLSFPQASGSPFTVGNIVAVEVESVLTFECSLFRNGAEVARIDSTPGPFEKLDWAWLDESAKDEFDEFIRSSPFPNEDLFVGTMVAIHKNIEWLRKECETDTLFRFASDEPHVFQRVRMPFSEELRSRIITRYGKNVFFYNDVLGRSSG